MAISANKSKKKVAPKRGATKVGSKESNKVKRWVLGATLFAFSLYMFVSILFFFVHWKADQAIVSWSNWWSIDGGQVSNPSGKLGATLASTFVGDWFGLFALIIPFVLAIFAGRILRVERIAMHRSIRISILIMILGSMTLGVIFGSNWGVFGTGLGGRYGILMAEWIVGVIGIAGTAISLLLGWILLAVYINSSAIGIVNKVGRGIVDTGVSVGGAVITKGAELVKSHHDHNDKEKQESKPMTYRSSSDAVEVDYEPIVEAVAIEPDKILSESVIDDVQIDEEPPFKITNSIAENVSFEVVRVDSEVKVEELEPEKKETTPKAVQTGSFTIVSPSGEPVSVVGSDVKKEDVFLPEGFEIVDMTTYKEPEIEQTVQEIEVAPQVVKQDEKISGIEVIGGYDDNDDSNYALSLGGVVESKGSDDGISVVQVGYEDELVEEEDIDETIYDPTLELSKYMRPTVDLLDDHSVEVHISEDELHEHKNHIVTTLNDFGISIKSIKATIGPTVTLYEIIPAAGVKISKIRNLEDDIALNLKALGIRIIAPMPGKGTVGIEVPNKEKAIVSMQSMVKTLKFQESKFELPVVLGRTIQNEAFMIDLAKMPHLLVAGATGQGKSVGLNAIITSLLFRKHPAELKFVFVDPKKVELSMYAKLDRHFLAKMESEDDPILTDVQKVLHTLLSLCEEMETRYNLYRLASVKKITEYNDKFTNRRLNPNKGHRYMPYLVVVIDEFADLIMTAGKEIEAPITRLAQMGRAVGIHLVIATQRPDVKVITGVIKANFPARIAFRVSSMIDSRTIIDQPGANQLIGRGDMLVSQGGTELTRVQCAFIDTPEIERITEFISKQKGYGEPYNLPDYVPDGDGSTSSLEVGHMDAMFEDIARYVVQSQQGSTSSIQRRFSIGYNRAGRIMDQLEAAGVVGRSEGGKPREVLILDLVSLDRILEIYS